MFAKTFCGGIYAALLPSIFQYLTSFANLEALCTRESVKGYFKATASSKEVFP